MLLDNTGCDIYHIQYIILKLSRKVSESRFEVWDLDFTTHFLASCLLSLACVKAELCTYHSLQRFQVFTDQSQEARMLDVRISAQCS